MKASKFSSWSQKDESSLNELDELLMEHDLLNDASQQPGKGSRTSKGANVGKNNGGGKLPTGEAKADNLIDIDQVLNEFGQSPEHVVGKNSVRKAATVKDGSENLKENSFDLENSDDLNRIISKYETMLS
jgi:hypothetical protein